MAEKCVSLRYFGGAADLIGTAGDTVTLPRTATVREVVSWLQGRYGDRVYGLLQIARFVVDDEMVDDLDVVVGVSVDVLPPFAGG